MLFVKFEFGSKSFPKLPFCLKNSGSCENSNLLFFSVEENPEESFVSQIQSSIFEILILSLLYPFINSFLDSSTGSTESSCEILIKMTF